MRKNTKHEVESGVLVTSICDPPYILILCITFDDDVDGQGISSS